MRDQTACSAWAKTFRTSSFRVLSSREARRSPVRRDALERPRQARLVRLAQLVERDVEPADAQTFPAERIPIRVKTTRRVAKSCSATSLPGAQETTTLRLRFSK